MVWAGSGEEFVDDTLRKPASSISGAITVTKQTSLPIVIIDLDFSVPRWILCVVMAAHSAHQGGTLIHKELTVSRAGASPVPPDRLGGYAGDGDPRNELLEWGNDFARSSTSESTEQQEEDE